MAHSRKAEATPADLPITYAIDGDDRLVAVNAAWSSFAEQNDGIDLLPEKVIGHSLWDFFSDMAVHEIYRLIFAHVRNGNRTTLTMRCDSDDTCRWIELRLAPLPERGIAFESRIVHTTPRASVHLLDASLPRSVHYIRVCSWCNRLSLASTRWYELDEALTTLPIFDEALPPQVTHCMCEACYASLQNTFGLAEAAAA
jgi:hypothetical protein